MGTTHIAPAEAARLNTDNIALYVPTQDVRGGLKLTSLKATPLGEAVAGVDGSMTDLNLAERSVAGRVVWYSLIHLPDTQVRSVFTHFQRMLRPGCVLLLSFHVGDETTLKTEGYGGHSMKVHVYRRQPAHVAAWLTSNFNLG